MVNLDVKVYITCGVSFDEQKYQQFMSLLNFASFISMLGQGGDDVAISKGLAFKLFSKYHGFGTFGSVAAPCPVEKGSKQ